MNTTPIIATRISNWYHVPTANLTEDLLEYFTGRAQRDPLYTKISEDTVSWTTKFEWADKLEISTAYSKNGMLYLATTPVQTEEQRKAEVEKLRAEFNEKKAVVTKTTPNLIVTDSDL